MRSLTRDRQFGPRRATSRAVSPKSASSRMVTPALRAAVVQRSIVVPNAGRCPGVCRTRPYGRVFDPVASDVRDGTRA